MTTAAENSDSQPARQHSMNAVGGPRELALMMAVIHHGLGNFAQRSIPARPNTVIETAKEFEQYIRTGRNGTGGQQRR